MTRIFDDPANFTDDMLVGFLDANARYVTGVPGGVVRATTTRPGKVAVVVGGGSGHYPAFCGIVGPGFADGAVVGNVFTSPSAADAASVGRGADGGAGVVFSTGNYAGDVMNFNQAVQRLAAEGIEARYVLVTDDVASAPATERSRRRGIAGDFTVFKVASAAAEEGYDLDGVVRVAEHANGRTRTLGVAFDGCTMPGAREPLFMVEPGRMGLGLGIHGEPGIADEALPRAADLARTLVNGVLAEQPDGAGTRVTAILNGLGRTKYEELFILWATVSRLLREAGLDVVEPEVGELVTSLDMAGCSLTLMWLDDELERLWSAPADTPAYRKGAGTVAGATGERRRASDATTAIAGERDPAIVPDRSERPADEAALRCAATALTALEAMAHAVGEAEEELGRLDAVAGDGDHGRGMVRGSAAAVQAARHTLDAGAGPGSLLIAAGDAWASKAGGTSGVLWGAAIAAMGRRVGDAGRPDEATVAAGVRDGYLSLISTGGAKPGDKTMLDALLPFTEWLSTAVAAGEPLATAWAEAAREAERAAEATASLRPQVGRARPLAERSLGTPDPGAVSMALCLRAVADVLGDGH
ncbi:dihydroxyacetone kinase family protein [Micromonospora sp. NBC_00389]|uniref:dihydroxyacetone kinase family protein n=1 Tax=Micromonospora sp. NBC_00389 TaxID=2903586 RepID=UPI002E1F34AF